MRERPILFSGSLVRAILEGRKTVTRRLIQPSWWRCLDPEDEDDRTHAATMCPHGAPGDRLWVRETHAFASVFDGLPAAEVYRLGDRRTWYQAQEPRDGDFGVTRWRPSIHMPRWASRIDLEIVSVRAERLQDITARDVAAEGVALSDIEGERPPDLEVLAVARFAHLWDFINGKRPGASWADNPWVWRIEFRRVRPHEDVSDRAKLTKTVVEAAARVDKWPDWKRVETQPEPARAPAGEKGGV